MKKASLLVLLVAVSAWAQSGAEGNTAGAVTPQGTLPTTASFPIQRVQMPTYADVYCAGFINRQSLPDANFVAGGLETPSTTKFVRGDLVYLEDTTGKGHVTRLGGAVTNLFIPVQPDFDVLAWVERHGAPEPASG